MFYIKCDFNREIKELILTYLQFIRTILINSDTDLIIILIPFTNVCILRFLRFYHFPNTLYSTVTVVGSINANAESR